MKNAAIIEAFLEMMSAERGAAANTLEAYRRDLEEAAGFLSQQKQQLAAADAASVRAYIENISAQGFAASSQSRRLSSLRQFYRFLYAENHRRDDPTATIDSPRKARPLPKTLSVDDVGRMLDLAEQEATEGGDFAALRLYAPSQNLLYSVKRDCPPPTPRPVALVG